MQEIKVWAFQHQINSHFHLFIILSYQEYRKLDFIHASTYLKLSLTEYNGLPLSKHI